MLWVLTCTLHLTLCSCHVTYAFQSESRLYSCLNVKDFLTQSRRKILKLNDCNWTWFQNDLVWPNFWAVLWVLTCTLHLTVCSCHFTYGFQSESTLCSCLNVKELIARSWREIFRLNDCNWTRIQKHLVRIWKLSHLAKLTKILSGTLSTYLYIAFDCIFLSCHVRISEWIHTL